MKRLLAIALLVLAGCSSSGDAKPGSADVYQRIATATDCGVLQGEFNTAMDNVERYPGGSDQRKIPMSYATAAQARMDKLDCP